MSEQTALPENFSRPDDVKIGSDRGFGLVFAAACSLFAGFMLWNGRAAFWAWLGAAILFLALAVFFPRALRPLNIVWFKFGLLLHHIITPVVLALMFFTVFVPIGLMMRIAGKRPLHLGFEKQTKSYWIVRQPPGPPPGSFKNQF